MTKYARLSIFSGGLKDSQFECKNEWPEDCFCQCGSNGTVFTPTGYYETAFFEAFPNNPKTFIRGEGKTIELAEQQAWETYQKYFQCDHPSFEARDYTNGAGFCTKCGLWFPDVIPPTGKCVICDTSTWFSQDIDNNWWCEQHYDQTPKEKWTEHRILLEKWKEQLREDEEQYRKEHHGDIG